MVTADKGMEGWPGDFFTPEKKPARFLEDDGSKYKRYHQYMEPHISIIALLEDN